MQARDCRRIRCPRRLFYRTRDNWIAQQTKEMSQNRLSIIEFLETTATQYLPIVRDDNENVQPQQNVEVKDRYSFNVCSVCYLKSHI